MDGTIRNIHAPSLLLSLSPSPLIVSICIIKSSFSNTYGIPLIINSILKNGSLQLFRIAPSNPSGLSQSISIGLLFELSS